MRTPLSWICPLIRRNCIKTKLAKEATRRRLAEERLLANLHQLHWTLDAGHLPEVVVLLCSYVARLQSKVR